jgi:AraC-like DNA-binding protein
MSRRPLFAQSPLPGAGAPRGAPLLRGKKKRGKLLYCEAQPLFLAIASDTLERIRRQCQQAPEHLRPILTHMERYLFCPGLSATQIYLACNIRDRSTCTLFRRATGATPARYIESCRMEVGERLVRETGIKITWISAMLGYNSMKVFANAFGRLTHEKPLTYRKKHQGEALEKGLPPRSQELEHIVKLRRALRGTLAPEEAAPLLERLNALYPTTAGAHAADSKRGIEADARQILAG